jgi:hypothetical protein
LSALVSHNFYFNELYNYFATFNFYAYYVGVFINFDKGLLEMVGPSGLSAYYFVIIN